MEFGGGMWESSVQQEGAYKWLCSLQSCFKPNQHGGQLSTKENRSRNRANQAVLSNPVIPQRSVQFLFPGSTAGNRTAVI